MQWPPSFTFNDLGIFSQILVLRLIHGYDIHKQFFVSLDCQVKPKEISRVKCYNKTHNNLCTFLKS